MVHIIFCYSSTNIISADGVTVTREQAEREREAGREQAEREEVKANVQLQREIALADRKHDQELEIIRAKQIAASSPTPETAMVSHKVPKIKLPCFDDNKDDLEAYLHRFELYIQGQGVEKKDCGLDLSALLKGDALKVEIVRQEKENLLWNLWQR